jgi:hypothetical protein
VISGRSRARKILRKIEIQQNPESQPSDENISSLAPSHSNLNILDFLFNTSDFPFLSRLRDPNTRRCDNTFYSGINLAQKAMTGERDI